MAEELRVRVGGQHRPFGRTDCLVGEQLKMNRGVKTQDDTGRETGRGDRRETSGDRPPIAS
jgi:hypothetical protein